MMDSEAILRLLSMLTQGGRGQATAGPPTPPTQLPPDYAARQLMGGGMLGGALAQRQQQLADPTAIAAAAQGAQGAMADAAPAAIPGMPPGGVFMRPDDPSTMNPAELLAYMKAHNIKKPSGLDELIAFMQKAAAPATAAASSGAKSLASIFSGSNP
jgi:hypothetical protein